MLRRLIRALLLLLAVLAAITAALATALWYSPALQELLLRRMAAQQLRVTLPRMRAGNALRIVFCGTGAPFPDPQAAKSCLAVFAGQQFYLVDSGPKSTENLVAWRAPLPALSGVLLTHFHSDHIGDLGELNMQSWVQGRQQPLPVYGPLGVERVVAGFNEAYALDQQARHAHHARNRGILPLAAATLVAHRVSLEAAGPLPGLPSAVLLEHDGLRITAFAVDHGVVRPAYGYRFDYRGRSLVVSGDTRLYAPLAIAAHGVDVLVHEAQAKHLMSMLSRESTAAGNATLGLLLADTNDYHTTPVEAARLANTAGVRELVFTHFSPPATHPLVKRAFFRGVDAVRPTGWRAAQDGLFLDLPANSSEIDTGILTR